MAPLLCLTALVVVGCSPDHYPQTALRPISDFGRIGDDIQTTTFKWAVVVFILVEGALLYAIFRFRGKPGIPSRLRFMATRPSRSSGPSSRR